jgi:hypothetical protein
VLGQVNILVNHGYLAVDFFRLSGSLIEYAYVDCRQTMTSSTLLKCCFE